jgi:hypothetical protein
MPTHPEGIRYPSSIFKRDQIINQSEFTRTILRAPRCAAPRSTSCPRSHGVHHGPPKIPRQEGEACAYAWVYTRQLLTSPRLELASYRRSPLGRPWSPATLCFKCFSCFRLMFQVFHLDVTKVDLQCCIRCNDNVRMLQAYVSSGSNVSVICFKCFIRMLHMLLWLYPYVSSVYFKCFTVMLQVFRLDVVYIAIPIHTCFKLMFQVFHLFQKYVANVSSRCFKSTSACRSRLSLLLGRSRGSTHVDFPHAGAGTQT